MDEQFKAGDRVEYRNDYPKDPANGAQGIVLGESEYSDDLYARMRVKWDEGHRPMPEHPFTHNLRTVEPPK